MPTKQYTAGANPESPVNGQTVFEADFLKTCFVNYIIVNGSIETQLDPSPDFIHNYIHGKITRTNPYITGDKVIIDYTPCNCK